MHDNRNIDQLAEELAGGLSLDELRLRQSPEAIAERRRAPQSAEQREALAEYWQRVFEQPVRPLVAAHARRFEQEMDYETARKRFFALMKLRAAHIAMNRNNPDWDWDYTHGNFAANITALLKYFINDPTGPLPLAKGVFVFGLPGTGKTEVLEALERFCKQENLTKQFTMCSMAKAYDDTRADKDFNPISAHLQFDRCFDEFARHVGPVLRFGDPLDVNEAIIEARYTRFQRYGQLTHFISNGQPNECLALLSPMIADRLRGMCSSVHFTGESKR